MSKPSVSVDKATLIPTVIDIRPEVAMSAALLPSSILNMLGARCFNGVIIFAGNISIYSKGSKKEHNALVEEILEALSRADARMKLSNEEFLGAMKDSMKSGSS